MRGTPREGWQRTVESQGLVFGTPARDGAGDSRNYWDESVFYEFDMDEVLSIEAQVEVLRSAYTDAAVDPRGVDYIEAHGTGTVLGDPIEADALGRVVGRGRQGRGGERRDHQGQAEAEQDRAHGCLRLHSMGASGAAAV